MVDRACLRQFYPNWSDMSGCLFEDGWIMEDIHLTQIEDIVFGSNEDVCFGADE